MNEKRANEFYVGDVVYSKTFGPHTKVGIIVEIDSSCYAPYVVSWTGNTVKSYYHGDQLLLLKASPNRPSNKLEVKKVIFSGNCTIVLFTDNTKVIVRAEGEEFDKEKGLAMALAKRAYGTNEHFSNYYDIFKKWIPEEKSVKTTLKDIDTGKLHYVKVPESHIVIDFDIPKEENKNIVISNNPCVDCPDKKNGCLTNCKKMQEYADRLYNASKDYEERKKSLFEKYPLKDEEKRVKEIEERFGEKVRAMREKNKLEEVTKGFIGDFYFKKDYHAQMFPKEFLQFCIDNDLVFYLDDGKETMVDPKDTTYVKVTGYLNKTHLPATTKQKYVCGTKFHGWRPSIAVDVNYVVFSKRPR